MITQEKVSAIINEASYVAKVVHTVNRLSGRTTCIEKDVRLLVKEIDKLKEELTTLTKPPDGVYSCGCPTKWAERKIAGFCSTHYKPLKKE